MVLIRRIQKDGATIVVEANAEVLFAPTGDVGRWSNRLTQTVRAATAAEAPDNKRPRWGHYGLPLKSTFKASTTYQPGRMRIYSAIGSTSPHAYYVDQGTGVYAGRGPYRAKVLPPWHRGSPTLYESTWRPAGPGHPTVSPVMIKGQRGQKFFEKGLKRGFETMGMRTEDIPGAGVIGEILSTVPAGLEGFFGNTEGGAAFRASLAEWRSWRDAAWKGHQGPWGDHGVAGIRSARIRARAARAAARKAETIRRREHAAKVRAAKPVKAKPKPTLPKKVVQPKTLRDKQNVAEAAFRKQNPKVKIKGRTTRGLVVISPVTHQAYVVPWSSIYNLM